MLLRKFSQNLGYLLLKPMVRGLSTRPFMPNGSRSASLKGGAGSRVGNRNEVMINHGGFPSEAFQPATAVVQAGSPCFSQYKADSFRVIGPGAPA